MSGQHNNSCNANNAYPKPQNWISQLNPASFSKWYKIGSEIYDTRSSNSPPCIPARFWCFDHCWRFFQVLRSQRFSPWTDSLFSRFICKIFLLCDGEFSLIIIKQHHAVNLRFSETSWVEAGSQSLNSDESKGVCRTVLFIEMVRAFIQVGRSQWTALFAFSARDRNGGDIYWFHGIRSRF